MRLTLQQAVDKFLTGDETSPGQCRGKMALAQADLPLGSLWITAERRLHQVIQSVQNPRLGLGRGLLSTTLPAHPVTASDRPGSKVRQSSADGAARNPGRPRNRGDSAVASSSGFTRGEQAPVSLVEERAERIEAGQNGIMVDHSARLDRKPLDSL